ncbi:hypothetical protein WMY93_014470 [Mugilogobius chulae]|uniref:Uncharacterized protein n=1 Tax=Mugilogobius chulae TaxID=88201 RepID=A0AAW0NZ37_9GOBI
MLKLPLNVAVQKDNVLLLLYGIGGLLVTVTATGQCLDLVLQIAQRPANLKTLYKSLFRSTSFPQQASIAADTVKQKQKKLYFTRSFCSLLNKPWQTEDTPYIFLAMLHCNARLKTTAPNCAPVKRIYYIFLFCVSCHCQPVFILSGTQTRKYDGFVCGGNQQTDSHFYSH